MWVELWCASEHTEPHGLRADLEHESDEEARDMRHMRVEMCEHGTPAPLPPICIIDIACLICKRKANAVIIKDCT